MDQFSEKILDSKRRASLRERAFLYWTLAGGTLFAVLAAFEVLIRRPGLGAPEELANLADALRPGETGRFWLRIGGAALSKGIMALALLLPLGWRSIYLFNVLALGLAAWGLWSLGRRLGGGEAAAFTLALAYCAPFSFLQARTTFSYVLAPALVLGLVWALRRPWGALASAALGLAAVLAWMDYEAWILVVPALVGAWYAGPGAPRVRGFWVLAGAVAGCLVLGCLERPYLAQWVLERGSTVSGGGRGLLANLKGFFFGGGSSMGLGPLAAFPWEAWPGLLAGLLVAPSWLWIWALGGLLGLAIGGPFMEPNRAVLAWPALLLIAGMGYAYLRRRLLPRLGPVWLGIIVLVAPLVGYQAFGRAIAGWDAQIHGPSREVFQMAGFLEQRASQVPVVLGGALENLYYPLLQRMVAARLGDPKPGAETWFLVPRSMADPGDARWGRWQAFLSPGDSSPLYLLNPSSRGAALLSQAVRDLEPEARIQALPSQERQAALARQESLAGNPWSWTAWAQQRLQGALQLGRAQAGDVLPLLNGPCLGTVPLEAIHGALAQRQPALAVLAQKREEALDQPGQRWDFAFGKTPGASASSSSSSR